MVQQSKCERHELEVLKQEIQSKLTQHEFDMFVTEFNNAQSEHAKRIEGTQRDFDEFVDTVQNELNNMKSATVQSLNKKADFQMIDRQMGKLQNDMVQAKVDNDQVREQFLQSKGEVSQQIELLKSDLALERQQKDLKVQERVDKIEMSADRALDEIYSYKEQLRQLKEERKNDIMETGDFIKSMVDHQKSDTKREFDLLKGLVDKQGQDIVDRATLSEVLQIRANIEKQVDKKVNFTDVQETLTNSKTELVEKLGEVKKQLTEKLQGFETQFTRVLERKIDHHDMKIMIDEKMDRDDTLNNFVSREDFEPVRKQVHDAAHDIQFKLNQDHFEQFDQQMEQKLADIVRQLGRKSNIKDVCALMDMKANTEEVNKALDEIHEEMDKQVVTKTELDGVLQEQNLINEALCAENCSARWLWKSGDLQNGFAIPWEVQTINTCPENFLWDEDKSIILTVAPGLYEVNFGFYCGKQPTVQVLVNGEPILSAVNSSSYVIHHSSGKLKSTGKQHSAGNLTGLTMIDFISLPARARVSLSYNGEKRCEGFFGLRKL